MPFTVIELYREPFNPSYGSLHLNYRLERLQVYKHLFSDIYIDCFLVDTNHPNGLEIHCLNDKGLIYIYNQLSLKLITIIPPRPKQYKRYYNQLGLVIPEAIKRLMRLNEKRNKSNNYNEL